MLFIYFFVSHPLCGRAQGGLQQEGCPYLFTYAIFSSLVAEEMQARKHPGAHSSPADKEGSKIDAVSRKVYSSALNLRIANDGANVRGSPAIFTVGGKTLFIDLLPENKKPIAKLLQPESVHLSKQ